ncbi:MAG: hypothetical protein DRJ10_14045 [Bacteroidetes bacterium]|nr:MAG: hypothetical protein DRJ10_14045 [Bacteroidota bacterium]
MSSYKDHRKKWQILTGSSIIVMAIVAGFAYGFVRANIYRAGDFELTAKLLHENITLFKFGILSWVVIFVLDIIVSIGLYAIYKESNKKLAIVVSGLRVIYTLFLGVAVTQLLAPLISNNEIANSLSYFESFENIWSVGLIIFGFHLSALGVICLKSNFTPKFWGIILIFGGVCYIIVHSLKSFFPNLSEATLTMESILTVPMAFSEIGFAIWLLIKAIRLKESENYDKHKTIS